MRNTIAAIIAFAIITTGHAAPAPYPVTINSRAQTAPALLVYRANPATFRVSFTDGSDASAITDETPFMAWATNALATNNSPASYSVVSATNGTVEFTFSAASVNYAAGRYVYEVGLNTGTGPKTYRQGVFTIQASTVGASVPAVSWTNAVINWGLYGFTGTASKGPVRPDGSTITASNNTDGSITISSLAATPAWSSVTSKPFTNLTDLTEAALTGITWTRFVTTNALVGYAGTSTVAAIDMRVSVLETNTATAAQGTLADGALQRSGGTMTGAIDMGTDVLTGRRFGILAGHLAAVTSNSTWSAHGYSAGVQAEGNGWTALGVYSGNSAVGDNWGAVGFMAGMSAIHTNSASFGQYAGRSARGNNRGYWDVYAADPSYPANGATNDTIFLDNDGKLYLGGGAARAENPSAGGVLRGSWTVGSLPDYYLNSNPSNFVSAAAVTSIVTAATHTPTYIQWSTNVTLSLADGISQAITNAASSAITIQWPAAGLATENNLTLTVPPLTTNYVGTLSSANGATYKYVTPLTNGLSTTNGTALIGFNRAGSTNWTVTVFEAP